MAVNNKSLISTICLAGLSIVLLANQSNFASCGSILFYMPIVTKSIRITFMPVATEMAKRGHEVVVVTQHPDKKPNLNFQCCRRHHFRHYHHTHGMKRLSSLQCCMMFQTPT